jgi:hypothetical protein
MWPRLERYAGMLPLVESRESTEMFWEVSCWDFIQKISNSHSWENLKKHDEENNVVSWTNTEAHLKNNWGNQNKKVQNLAKNDVPLIIKNVKY